MLFLGPSLVFLFERRFPQRGMSRRILFSVVVTNLALVGWALGWSALVGWPTYLLMQGATLVAGGAVAAWMLYIQHQYEETYYEVGSKWQFELAALQGRGSRTTAFRAAHEQQPMFARTPVVTVRSSIDALRLKLWDEQRGCLVRYPARRARSVVGVQPIDERERTLVPS